MPCKLAGLLPARTSSRSFCLPAMPCPALQPNFVYPSAVDNFKRQFAHLEAGGRGQANPNLGQVGGQGGRWGRAVSSQCFAAALCRIAGVAATCSTCTIWRLGAPACCFHNATIPLTACRQDDNPLLLPQATSLPRERVGEFRSEAQKYLTAQRGVTQHMSGVAGATAYQQQAAAAVGGNGSGAAYPYGSSVDMEGAVEMVSGPAEWAAGSPEQELGKGSMAGCNWHLPLLAPPAWPTGSLLTTHALPSVHLLPATCSWGALLRR